MKTALIQAPVWYAEDMPLSVAQLAGPLKSAGHETHVLDLNILLCRKAGPDEQPLWHWENFHYWHNPELVRKHIAANKHFIEGAIQKLLRAGVRAAVFVLNPGNRFFSLELARMLKREKPDIFTIFGGQYFFLPPLAELWIQTSGVDCFCKGIGDTNLPFLLHELEKTGRPPLLPGILLRGSDGMLDGGPEPSVVDLDAMPFSDFTVLPEELYPNKVHIPFQSSRGCLWKCRYCSTTNFWPSYNQMSGERIFAELMHHKKLFPKRTHVEFHDLMANGRPETLHKLSELLIDDHKANGWKNFFGWKINSIIRPEMTPGLLRKLRQAFCKNIIYGLESGSPKVRRLMNKNYDQNVALRVLKDTHDADILATANFMFGFPGETEDDFKQTLTFLEQVAPYLHYVYGSATFTSLEQGSYLTDHRKEFGVKIPRPELFHNLYWETMDGSNTYPVRMERYKRFRERAIELGLDAYKGVQGSLEQSSKFDLALYYRYKGQPVKAVDNLLSAFNVNHANAAILNELAPYYGDLQLYHRAARQFLRLARAPQHPRRERLEKRINELSGQMRDKAVLKNEGRLSFPWMDSELEPEKLSALLKSTHETVSASRPEEFAAPFATRPLLDEGRVARLRELQASRIKS